MKYPDVDFQSTSIHDLTQLFFENGCVLLRGFGDPKQVKDLQSILSNVYDELGHFHVFDQEMIDRGYRNLSSYVFTDKHRELLDALFGRHAYAISYPTTCARRVSAPNAKEGWQPPLGFHVDAGFHTLAFTVNFWMPFQPCGVDAPSLAVVKSSLDEMVEYSQFDGKPEDNRGAGEWLFHHFQPVIFDAASNKAEATRSIFDHFGERVWKPTYEPGDAMLISNYTLHGTHATQEMTKSREGMELRFSSGVPLATVLEDHKLALIN